MKRPWLTVIFCSLIFLAIGFWSGWQYRIAIARSMRKARLAGSGPVRLNDDATRYTNPLLFCNVSENVEFNEFEALKNSVRSYLETTLGKNIDHVSVYYRTLDTGHWFGIGENDRYDPASMLKLPTLITVLKYTESHPETLERRTTYTPELDTNLVQHFPHEASITIGKNYSTRELITAMIAHSNNAATLLLHQGIDQDVYTKVFTDLGVELPPSSYGIDFLSAKSYSHFFRTLYNSTYLSQTSSEEALSFLSQSDFTGGLRGGLPQGTKIASKYGERELASSDGKVLGSELHDCGIIYSPSEPYLLCVMTKGHDLDVQNKLISDISRIVWEQSGGKTATTTASAR